jgi:Concanavalin A-like lectin/glucanases superfamily
VARGFNGSSDKITANYVPLLNNFTSAAWINPATLTQASFATIVNNGNANNNGWAWGMGSIGYATNFLSGLADGVAWVGTSYQFSTANIWYHVAVTFASGTWNFYVDGVQVATNTSGMSAPSSPEYDIGHNTGQWFWDGSIADNGLWNVILSSNEITALATGVRPGQIRRQSLVFWMPLDGLASPEPDLSGNANNGTLNGTTKVFGPPFGPFTWTKGSYLPSGSSPPPPPPSTVQRRTMSPLGTRTGSRQPNVGPMGL